MIIILLYTLRMTIITVANDIILYTLLLSMAVLREWFLYIPNVPRACGWKKWWELEGGGWVVSCVHVLLVHQWESLSWFKDLASIIRCRISSYSCHIEILRVSKLCLMHAYYVAARQCIHMSTYTTVAERDTAAAAKPMWAAQKCRRSAVAGCHSSAAPCQNF